MEIFNPELLKNKTILVTGGGSGLGKAMALRFAQLGARVSIFGRTAKRLEETAQEIGKPEQVLAVPLDVRDWNAVEKGVGQIAKRFGKIDGLVNNAAGNFLCPSEKLSPNGFNAVVGTVLYGSFYCTLAVGREMISSGGGTILNILANYAETGASFVVPSAVAKAGVLNLTRSLAVEWAKYNIRLNAVAPGPIPTEGAWKALMPDPKIRKEVLKGIPAKRFGEPAELANLACFLMSEASSYMTGAFVTMDGGQSLADNSFHRLTSDPPTALKEILKK